MERNGNGGWLAGGRTKPCTTAAADAQTDNIGALPNSTWGSGKASSTSLLGSIPTPVARSARNAQCSLSAARDDRGRAIFTLLALAALAALALSVVRSHLPGGHRA